MSGRYVYEHRKQGDVVNTSPAAMDVGKKLLGYLADQRRLGLATSQSITREAPDGTLVTARFVGDQPEVSYQPRAGGGEAQELLFLYTSSPTYGLCVFDTGSKKMVRNFTGLETLSLLEVDDKGAVAYMGLQTLAARVDMREVSAFGKSYQLKTSPLPSSPGDPTVVGVAAQVSAGFVSPDGTRVVFIYEAGALDGGGGGLVIRDGMGAAILADGETLEPVREPIRGAIWSIANTLQAVAWSADSRFFYTTSMLGYDVGDLDNVDQFGLFYASDEHYLCKYTRDGELVSAVPLAMWGLPEVSRPGLGMMLRGVEVRGDRVYVSRISWFMPDAVGLYILDADDLSVLAFEPVSDFYSYVIQFAVQGDTLVAQGRDPDGTANDVYVVYDISDDQFARRYDVLNPELLFNKMGFGPRSRTNLPTDGLLFAAATNTDGDPTLFRGYRTLRDDPEPSYEFDLNPWNSRYDWHLANVGFLPAARRAA